VAARSEDDVNGERLPPPSGGRLRRPRFLYWIAGAVIAGGGALMARYLGDLYPDYRIFWWMTGGAVIFVGLAVLSLGTRSHLSADNDEGQGTQPATAGRDEPDRDTQEEDADWGAPSALTKRKQRPTRY
jgi:hypothetical protein